MTGQAFTGTYGDRKYSAQPDNVKDFFRTGLSLNNSIGVSGGSDKMQTYLSYTNNSVQGIMPRNDLNRHTFNLRISNNITKRLSPSSLATRVMSLACSCDNSGACSMLFFEMRSTSATESTMKPVRKPPSV